MIHVPVVVARNIRNVAGGRVIMISPDKVCKEAKRLEDENYRFRSYLKSHAEEKELDERFFRLHKELFGSMTVVNAGIAVKCIREHWKIRTSRWLQKSWELVWNRLRTFF